MLSIFPQRFSSLTRNLIHFHNMLHDITLYKPFLFRYRHHFDFFLCIRIKLLTNSFVFRCYCWFMKKQVTMGSNGWFIGANNGNFPTIFPILSEIAHNRNTLNEYFKLINEAIGDYMRRKVIRNWCNPNGKKKLILAVIYGKIPRKFKITMKISV